MSPVYADLSSSVLHLMYIEPQPAEGRHQSLRVPLGASPLTDIGAQVELVVVDDQHFSLRRWVVQVSLNQRQMWLELHFVIIFTLLYLDLVTLYIFL